MEESTRAERENIRIERQFDRGKRIGCHWRIAFAVAGGERPPAYGFRDKSVFAGDEGSAAATVERSIATKTGDCFATGADHSCRAVRVVNSKTGSRNRTIGRSVASAICVSAFQRANAHLREHHESREVRG